jgi:aspartate-semialdehyde dehydrogenase
VAAPEKRGLSIAIVGAETQRGQEVKDVLACKKFPLKSIEFYDPAVGEEWSKLSQFGDEPKVVHHLDRKSLEGLDLVFLAADAKTNSELGGCAAAAGYKAVDLAETFNAREDVPLVVAGVNDASIRGRGVPLVANANPATIMLSHLLKPLGKSFGMAKALAFVLEPASAFGGEGVDELYGQSVGLLGGSSMPKKVFREQLAFNLLSRTERPDKAGFSPREARIAAELRRVLAPLDFPLSLTLVLAPVFHTYSIMTYVELGAEAEIADLAASFRGSELIKLTVPKGAKLISGATVAGKDRIFIGQIKRDAAIARAFWVWAVADNLTVGSALNAYGIACSLFEIS